MSFKAVGASFVGLSAIGIAIASIWMNPIVTTTGLLRPVENIGTERCITESCKSTASVLYNYADIDICAALQACESNLFPCWMSPNALTMNRIFLTYRNDST